jgi:uncharacterized protein YjiS (DUF1127 family)
MSKVRSGNELAGAAMALVQSAEIAKLGTRRARAAWFGGASILVRRWLSAIIDLLLAWRRVAAERHHLAGLSDHHLRDIGVSRTDVEDASPPVLWFR